MSDRYPGALLVSITLHGAVVGLMFLFAYAADQARPDVTQVFELVAGDGDNFAATQAPAYGEPGAPKLDVPKPLPETPRPKEVAPPEPAPTMPTPPPVAEKPLPKPPEDKPLPKPKDFAKEIDKKVDRAEQKTKAKLAKEHEAEPKKLTKEQFDRENQKKVASAKPAGPTKVAQIDADGIRKGVVGSSPDNKTGGAGGKALVRTDGSVMDTYFAFLKENLRKALDKPPGLSDSLVTTVEFFLNADGTLTSAKITKSSGNAEFDAAALAAVAATRMPSPRPDKISDKRSLSFTMKELN